MKTLRTLIPYFCIAVIASVVLFSPKEKPKPPQLPKGKALYDTSLLMLKEFVLECNDSNLGFSNFADLDSMRIDTNRAIRIYCLREDSLLQSDMPLDSHLVKLNRKVYPVYVHDKLRASITFQRSDFGWEPVLFSDSNIMAMALQELPAKVPAAPLTESAMIVEAPFAKTRFTRYQDEKGWHCIPTADLKKTVAKNNPIAKPKANKNQMDEADFLGGLRSHTLALHEMSKKSIRKK